MKYIGMDAHSKTCFFVVKNKRGKVLMSKRVKTTEVEILNFVHSVKGKRALAFEEGVLSQWLFLLLKEEVDELVVCQPAERPGPKNDEIDAGEIADLLRVGRLKSVFHADSELMNLRTLISGYDDLIEVIGQQKNRLKALFRQVAIPTDDPKFYSSPEMLWQLPTDNQQYVACTFFEQIALLEEQKRGYMERFESNVSKHREVKLLKSIPGIGPVRANQLVGIMVTPYRFEDKYHLWSYAMLVKHKRESDGKIYGKKQANGRPLLKEIFKSSVFGAKKSNTAFKREYNELRAAGKDDRAARAKLARTMAGTVLAVWKTGKKYDDKHREVTRRRNQKSHSGT